MPIDERRRATIEAAVTAYDSANPMSPLPRTAAQLLAAMFPSEDVCQRSQEDIAAAGFSRDSLSRHRVAGVPNTYRLHLPPAQS